MISAILNNNPTLTEGYDPSTINPIGKHGLGTCVESHKSKVLLGGSGRCTMGFKHKEAKPGKWPGNIYVEEFYD